MCVLLCVCVGQQGHALAQNSVLALNNMFAGPQARHMHAWKQGRGLAPPTLCINNGVRMATCSPHMSWEQGIRLAQSALSVIVQGHRLTASILEQCQIFAQ